MNLKKYLADSQGRLHRAGELTPERNGLAFGIPVNTTTDLPGGTFDRSGTGDVGDDWDTIPSENINDEDGSEEGFDDGDYD